MVDVIVSLSYTLFDGKDYILSSKGEVPCHGAGYTTGGRAQVIYAYHSALKEMNGNPCHSAS